MPRHSWSVASVGRHFSSPLLWAVVALAGLPAGAQVAEKPAASAPAAAPLTLDQRLDWLATKLESRRKDLHIPGIALALVKDDKVIFAKGFGEKNVATHDPVTPESIFAIGSSTKAFTSMLCAMMVDQGKMKFDDPITTYLPDFKLNTEEFTKSTTIRDALSHRTGLARIEMTWAANKVSRKEAIAQLRYAEPYAPPRTTFLYSNLMFMTAGDAVAAAGGAESWEAMVQDKILTPLGMTSTTPLTSKAKDDPRRALGYSYVKETGQYRELPMRILDAAAPAGAINSNVLDMSRWIRFLLNKGEFEGKRLIKPDLFDSDLWAQQNAMGPGAAYGLGWMLDKWQGKRQVHHGGNIDGYGAMVALLPDEHVGLVLLTNVTATPLQDECKSIAWTALFGSDNDLRPASVQPGAKSEAELQPYVGVFDFAALHVQVTALVKDGKLCLDVPGQTVYALKWPNDKGRWVFELTDAIEVEFQPGDDGKMKSITLYQAGQKFVMPRVGAENAVAADPNAKSDVELRPYLGKYDFALQKSQITALIKDGKLSLDVPGQRVYALKWPNEKGRWVFELTDAIEVDFQKNDDGTIKSMTMYQAGQTFVMPHLASDEAPVPTVAELSALVTKNHRGPSPKSIRLKGKVNFVHQGVSGPCTILADGEKFKMSFDLGKFGYITSGFDGTDAYMASDIDESKILTGQEAAQTRALNIRSVFDDPAKFYDKVEPQAWDPIKKIKAVKVKLTPKGAPATTVWYDAETGRPIREQQQSLQGDLGISLDTKVGYGEFKPLGNVDFPSRITMENSSTGRIVLEFDSLEADVAIDPKDLAIPATVKK